jgi:hypothetical protein
MLAPGADEKQEESVLAGLSVMITVLLALAASLHQQRLYRIFLGGGGEGANPWKVGIVALLLCGGLGHYLMLQVHRWTT